MSNAQTIQIYEKKASHIKNLKIYTDEIGLLRCDGRIKNSTIDLDAKFPILLAKSTMFTKFLILRTHELMAYSRISHTLAELRKKYWLPHGRRVVYTTIKNGCKICKTFNAKPFKTPPMAPLPKFRVTPDTRPFTNVRIDVFSPILIRTSLEKNEKAKRWIVIFTC